MPEYEVFAKEIIANSINKNIDQNILICTALSYLNQQVVDHYIKLTSILKAGFQKQKNRFNLIKSKLDHFSRGKVIFILTPSKKR